MGNCLKSTWPRPRRGGGDLRIMLRTAWKIKPLRCARPPCGWLSTATRYSPFGPASPRGPLKAIRGGSGVRMTRRSLLGGVAAGVTFGPAFAASATDGWPALPVRLISPYAAGGSSDISVRLLAEYFETGLGKKFYVENKAGAGSTIAN